MRSLTYWLLIVIGGARGNQGKTNATLRTNSSRRDFVGTRWPRIYSQTHAAIRQYAFSGTACSGILFFHIQPKNENEIADNVRPLGARAGGPVSEHAHWQVPMSSHLFEKNGITLRGRWREELEAVCADGTLIFEFTMGKEHLYFPDEKAWAAQAPDWARDSRAAFLDACEAWCREYRYPISIVPDTHIYEER